MAQLTLDQANQIITATLAKAREMHLAPLSVAVLDAGGIGKGVALDAMAAAVRNAGAAGGFFDFGGSSQLAFGTLDEAQRELRVMVAGYRAGAVHGHLQLRDGSVSTSRTSG